MLGLLIRIILSLDLEYIRVILTQVRTGVVWLKIFLTKCTDVGKPENIEVHLIEHIEEGDYDVEGKLWCRESIGKPKYPLCRMI